MILMCKYGTTTYLKSITQVHRRERCYNYFNRYLYYLTNKLLPVFLVVMMLTQGSLQEYCELGYTNPWMKDNRSEDLCNYLGNQTNTQPHLMCLPGCKNLTSAVCNSSNPKLEIMNRSLSFCNQHVLHTVLNNRTCIEGSFGECEECLTNIEKLDAAVELLHGNYLSVLERNGCISGNSTSSCTNCSDAYKNWVCAMLIPYYDMNEVHIKPCLQLCLNIQQVCPYLLPTVQLQYGGQPVFLCHDSNLDNKNLQKIYGDLEKNESCFYFNESIKQLEVRESNQIVENLTSLGNDTTYNITTSSAGINPLRNQKLAKYFIIFVWVFRTVLCPVLLDLT